MNFSNILGNMTPKHFFQHYWEKKPLVIRKALSHSKNFINKDLMWEMAFEPEIESRFLFQDELGNWSLFHNPIDQKLKDRFKKEKWTLINHAVNLFHRPMFDLQKSCHFIPQWNFDDIMVSYSMPGGNVGPHIDSYNVFIVQGHGKKRWMLNSNPDTTIVPDQELKMLSNFTAQEEYILEEGDVIYIPPHVAHYGIAITEGMSYSLGLNSLKPSNLIDSICRSLQNSYEDDQFVELPFQDDVTDSNKYQFTPSIHHSLIKDLQKHLTASKMEQKLCELLTTPRYWPEPNDFIPFEQFLDLMKTNHLYRDPYVRWNSLDDQLFINGKRFHHLPTFVIKELILLLENFPMDPLPLPKLSYRSYLILFELYLRGAIFFGMEKTQ